MRITIPIAITGEVENLGIIPNKNKITDTEIVALFNRAKSEQVPESVSRWLQAVTSELYPSSDSFAAIVDILAFPFSGQNDGRDCAGEFFHPATNFMIDSLPYPPVVNAHGIDGDGTGNARRTVVGQTIARWQTEEGGWVRIGVFKDTPYTEEIIVASKSGMLKASSYGLLKDTDPAIPGKIDVWLAGEISVILPSSNIAPCNWFAGVVTNQKTKEEIEELINETEEPYRSGLRTLLATAGEIGENVVLNNEPTNQADPPDEDNEEIIFSSNDEEGIDNMTKEELAEAVANGVKAGFAAQAAAVPPTPEPATEPEPDSRSKSAARAAIAAATTNAKIVAASTQEAQELTDAWINSGKVSPENRSRVVSTLSTLMLADERAKSDAGVKDFIALVEQQGFGLKKTDKIGGFGPKAKTDEVVEAEIDSMFQATIS